MQPLQCHLRVSAAQDTSIADAAAAARNLDTAIPLRSADLVAKPPKKKHNGYTNCRSKTGSRHPNGKTMILHHFQQELEKENRRQNEELDDDGPRA